MPATSRASRRRSPGSTREARLVQAPSDDGPGIVARLADALADDGIEVDDLGLRQPTLDDVFLTLTGERIADEPALEMAS